MTYHILSYIWLFIRVFLEWMCWIKRIYKLKGLWFVIFTGSSIWIDIYVRNKWQRHFYEHQSGYWRIIPLSEILRTCRTCLTSALDDIIVSITKKCNLFVNSIRECTRVIRFNKQCFVCWNLKQNIIMPARTIPMPQKHTVLICQHTTGFVYPHEALDFR